MVMDEVECPLLSRSFGAMSRWSAAAVEDIETEVVAEVNARYMRHVRG